jgi:hypothetical protein
MYEHTQKLEQKIQELSTEIAQRDELLRDMSENLRSERDTSEYLKASLDAAETKLEIKELSCDEMVDDLQQVSIDIRAVERELDRVKGEKTGLEMELATHIADLMDLECQNTDLKRHLGLMEPPQAQAIKPKAQTEAQPTQDLQAETPQAKISEAETLRTPDAAATASPSANPNPLTESGADPGQVVTVSSGKQIHVYHEFSTPPAPSLRAGFSLAAKMALRAAVILIVVLAPFIAISTLATAKVNHLSIGEAFDSLCSLLQGS